MATPKRPPRSLKGSGQVRLQRQKLQAQIREFVATAPQSATPDSAALVLATFAPTIAAPVAVTPPAAALVLNGFTPAIAAPRVVIPGTASLTLTGFAPTANVPLSVSVIPPTAQLTLTGYSPDVQGDLHSGGFGHVVSDTGRRPRFTVLSQPEPTDPISVTPPNARLTLTGYPPNLAGRSAVAFTLEELAALSLTAEELAAILAA